MEDKVELGLSIVGFVDSNIGSYFCYDLDNVDRVLGCLSTAFPAQSFYLETNEEIKYNADIVVLFLPEDTFTIYPISRKPKGWTWEKLVEVARVTKLLLADNAQSSYDAIHVFKN